MLSKTDEGPFFVGLSNKDFSLLYMGVCVLDTHFLAIL